MSPGRTTFAALFLALSCSPLCAQSLGEAARAERERRAQLPHHARVLSDEDLLHDKILPQQPPQSGDPVWPSSGVSQPDVSESMVDENLSLGEYARSLRQRRLAEQAQAEAQAATISNPEPQAATPVSPVLTPLTGAADPGQQTISLGEFARQARAEREAARRVRMHRTQPAVVANETTEPKLSPEHHARPTTSAHAPAPKPAPAAATTTAHTAAPTTPHTTEARQRPTPPSPGNRRAVLAPGALANGPIRVPRGGSLWTLARTYLGSGHLWPALWKANPQIKDPDRIQAGQMLSCPTVNHLERAKFSSPVLKAPHIAGSHARRNLKDLSPAAGPIQVAVLPAGLQQASFLTPAPRLNRRARRKLLFSRTVSR
jgi:nucleoid-associated protein YgaU